MEKLYYYSFHCHFICITVFFTWQAIGNAVSNTNTHIGMHWSCIRSTLIQKTRYFNIDLAAMDYYFVFIYFREVPSIWKKTKTFVKESFLFTQITGINQIYLLQNRFLNYVYLKGMNITLNGIGKTLFASVLKILLICKFLNCTTVFIKKN